MANFFVGQRVRVKHGCMEDPRSFGVIGQETRITGDGLDRGRECWFLEIRLDGVPMFCVKAVAGDFLEPILPDNQACDDDFKRDLDRLLERQGIAA